MELSTKYNPHIVESKWYAYWLKHKFFASKKDPNKEPFTIVIPPPNITGVLHMGHVLNNTIQDILIRKARMEGKNACWVPGTDHASIATEAKIVKMLKEKGIQKSEIGREKFLEYAWAWKEKYGGIILNQLQKLGASCDWDRTAFTMDEKRSKAVIDMFVRLYDKGLIYRGLRMVNWDPEAKTVLSNEEVIYKEVNSKLYYVKYKLVGSEEFIPVATARPETILGDTAVCVNPNDERYKHLVGKQVVVPIINRIVPIITDEYVAIDFGTGALKITPAHDMNDYEIGKKYNLAIIDTIAEDGTMSQACGVAKYVGKDRFVVRQEIVKDLEQAGLLLKVEDYKNQVGTSERTGAVVEPKLSEQWFIKMKELAQPALENVLNDNIQFHPPTFKNMYKAWIDNIQDWNISRQLWWGHRIPAYYLPNGEIVVAPSLEEAYAKALKINPNLKKEDLKQDEDVLDTWASSWLWAISVFDEDEIDYYYPTTVLVTGFDIIFFWVMRMIIAGYELRNEKPFHHVYFTGMVRDKLRRKMSKSLGNSPDVFKLMEKYSTDGVRYGIMASSVAGNDIIFDTEVPKSQKPEDIAEFEKLEPESKICETGRNFANKIWNALRLVKSWDVDENLPNNNQIAIEWFTAKLNQVLAEVENQFDQFRLSEAITTIYKLIWDEFCANYLEMIKPSYNLQAQKPFPIDALTFQATLSFFDTLMRLLHPFMPFITEEVWQNLQPRKEGESICIAPYPKSQPFDNQIIKEAEQVFEVIQNINNIRNEKQLKKNLELELYFNSPNPALYETKFAFAIRKLAKVGKIQFSTQKPTNVVSFVVKNAEFFVPLPKEINKEEEKAKISKEIDYLKGFRESVLKKLNNEKFIANAKPEVVANERQKLADAEAKIKALEESLTHL
ncbi:MAG: valine--tRNA ligase [Microscillaceae bacterium]|nr:valine--tRNA ligase [Microscillaceae bacterium]MDW8460932.1 valine--tRNA ligase [Cytophagales bacterium]